MNKHLVNSNQTPYLYIMTNNSPSQDYPFTGYRFHRKPVDLGKLWQQFTSRYETPEYKAWAAIVYKEGNGEAPDPGKVNKHFENQLQERNERGWLK
jgi:hypothetical protein